MTLQCPLFSLKLYTLKNMEVFYFFPKMHYYVNYI